MMNISTSLILVVVLSDKVFKYWDGATYWGYVGADTEPLYRILKFCALSYLS
jgi:hypothetical protein